MTCSGKSQSFQMPVLEFLPKFKPCSGIFAGNGDPKGRQVPNWSDMEVPPPPDLFLSKRAP